MAGLSTRAAALALTASLACAPERRAELGDRRTHVFVALGAGEVPLEVRVFDGDHAWIEDGRAYRVLGYDRGAAELQLSPDAEGLIPLVNDGWPLPPPVSAHALDPDGASEPLELAAIAPWLRAIHVPAPPCFAERPRGQPLRGLVRGADVAFAVPFGDGALLGFGAGFEGETRIEEPSVFFVRSADEVERLALALPRHAERAPAPRVALDGDGAWIAFPRTSSAGELLDYDLFRVDEGARVVERLSPSFGPELRPGAAANVGMTSVLGFARVAGPQRFLARVESGYVESGTTSRTLSFVVGLDEATMRWTPREPPSRARTGCHTNIRSNVFELEPDGRVLTPRAERELASFDPRSDPLEWETFTLGGTSVCRSARALLPEGLEVVAIEADSTFDATHLAWRVGAGPWSARPEQGIEALAMSAIPGGFALTSVDASLHLYRFSAARVDVGPVYCGRIDSLRRTGALALLRDGRLLVGGFSGDASDSGVPAELIDLSTLRGP